MSAKIIAASTPSRCAAVTVTSAASEGVLHSSRKPTFERSSRYSGMYRPAWRINQIGVNGVGSRRHARINTLSLSSDVSLFFVNVLSQKCDGHCPKNDTYIIATFPKNTRLAVCLEVCLLLSTDESEPDYSKVHISG